MKLNVAEQYHAKEVMQGIDEWLKEHELRESDLAKMTGISTNTFSRYRSGESPSITLQDLDTIISKGHIPYYQTLKYIKNCDLALLKAPKELVIAFTSPEFIAEMTRVASTFAVDEQRKLEISKTLDKMNIEIDYSCVQPPYKSAT